MSEVEEQNEERDLKVQQFLETQNIEHVLRAPFSDGHLRRRERDGEMIEVKPRFDMRVRFVCFHTKGRKTFAVVRSEPEGFLFPMTLGAFSHLLNTGLLNNGAVSGTWCIVKEGMFYSLEFLHPVMDLDEGVPADAAE